MQTRLRFWVALSFVLAIPAAAAAHNPVEPDAGNWRTWIISSGAEYRVPAPPSPSRTQRELRDLADLIEQNGAAEHAQIIPLIPVPNFPSYPSNHSTFSASRAEILAYLFPTRAEFIRAVGREAGDSRIWAGIHDQMDNVAGVNLGKSVAQRFIDWAKSDGSQ